MAKKNYGRFGSEAGSYHLDSLPESGNFEYIYKNRSLFLRVDQFGPSFLQEEAPIGMTALLRKDRETYSPWRVYFSVGSNVYHNFDVYRAKKKQVSYYPEKCVYTLSFGQVEVITEISLADNEDIVYMATKFTNLTGKPLKLRLLDCANLELTDTSMAVWDKKEWYEKTEALELDGRSLSLAFHSSVNGEASDRRYVALLGPGKAKVQFSSFEKCRSMTKGFTDLSHIVPCGDDPVVGYDQVASAYYEVDLDKDYTHLSALKIGKTKEAVLFDFAKQATFEKMASSQESAKAVYQKLTSLRSVKTGDENFNAFVNNFLPQELQWVADLDRGWPTGMRGSRDAANDFMGFIAYDQKRVRNVICTILNSVRKEDGWIPRQLSFTKNEKYDLREFMDSGCFVLELIYEYLCYTDDRSLLAEQFSYFHDETKESGLEHIIKIASFYCLENNIGEHGLIKLKGGDWCDCLNRVGRKGRAETLHVTAQAILSFRQVNEILSTYGEQYNEVMRKYDRQAAAFRKAIKSCFNESGFYNALFADDGNWFFSEKDPDGEMRVYTVSNSYCAIADVDKAKDKKALKTVMKYNRCESGIKIFTTPFGLRPLEALGKMSTGDFAPYMLENGSIYNHASFFFLRALAYQGDAKGAYDVLNFGLPVNQKYHPESDTCLPMYATTNSYAMVPGFKGRAALCFLTGSIAMAERSIYNWVFGIDFHMDFLQMRPCLAKQYQDSEVTMMRNGHRLHFVFRGFGTKVESVACNGKETGPRIPKELLGKDVEIVVTLK